MTPRLPPPILALSCGQALNLSPTDLVARVEAAVDAGLEGLLLRERAWSDGLLLETARTLRRVLGAGWLGLSDAPHLIRASAADGVHLSHRALTAPEVRALVGADVAIGISDHRSHPRDDGSDADYCFLSPLHAVRGKEQALGVDKVIAWAGECALPAWALGGVGPQDLQALRAGGLAGVACLRGLLAQTSPGEALTALRCSWGDDL